MSAILTTSLFMIVYGSVLYMVSSSPSQKNVGPLLVKVGMQLALVCAYLATGNYSFVFFYIAFAIVDFFLTFSYLAEKKGGI